MKHLITGGSGFIGNRLAKRLIERNEGVRVLDIRADPTSSQAVEFMEGSITNRETVASAMQGVDVVHHNAALVAQTGATRDQYWNVNVEGTRIVAEEASRAGVTTIVHVSTTAVFGIPPTEIITSETPLRPIEPYGRSKLAGEVAMTEVCARKGIRLITIRPRVALGAGRLGIYQLLFEWIREDRNIYVVGNGENRMQFIHVSDLVDFYLLALDSGRSGTYNVGTDRFGTLREELATLIAHAGSRSRIRHLPAGPAIATLGALYHMGLSPLVPWHYLTLNRDCQFDIQPLLALGWKPRYANSDMLRESYDWYTHSAVPNKTDMASPHRSPLKQGLLRAIKTFS